MKSSLRTKVSIFVTALIILVSGVSTYLFINAYSRSIERHLIARGTALIYSLARTAEQGLVAENLDLLKKAAYIVQARDVALVQVYSTIWDAVDAYPFERLQDPPHPSARIHFKDSNEPLFRRLNGWYDFYNSIIFKPVEDAPAVTIGYVRLILSTEAVEEEIRKIIFSYILLSALITLFAVISINIIIGRLVINPVMGLQKSVAMFKNGTMPDASLIRAGDEFGALSNEFYHMSLSVKEKEDRLIESETRIKNLFERVEHAIFRLDREGNIIESNARFTELFGTAKSFCSLLINDQLGKDCLLKALSGKVVQLEERVMDRHGEELIVLLSLYPFSDAAGVVKGYDGYIIDITEKKKLEERLLRAQKMEAVGTLAGGIAHDFNNILAGVLGYAEIIRGRIGDDELLKKAVNIIEDSAKRGASLARRILNVSRKERLELKITDINTIVRETVEILQRSIPKGIGIEMKLSEGLPGIKADPTQMQQVIMNLAINARDAMPDGGTMRIETSMVGMENGAANGLSADDGFIRLSVSDTGKGIEKEHQVRIFDPFFTTKGPGEGTGLGLYIVHSVVTSHGGYINLYSEPNKGTRFNIYFPAHAGKAEDVKGAEEEDLSGSGTVLVIDDEGSVRELVKDLLGPLGYTVVTAADGAEGIGAFREHRQKVAVVLLDMIMPKMGGAEVFQRLQSMDPKVKILLCSGYGHEGLAGIKNLLNNGAKGFVQKPFTKKTIGKAVKQALL